MATEADVTFQMVKAKQGSIFLWRNVQGIDGARDRAAEQNRTDLEFYPVTVLDDELAFVASFEDRPIVAVELDAMAILTSAQMAGYEDLLTNVAPAAEPE